MKIKFLNYFILTYKKIIYLKIQFFITIPISINSSVRCIKIMEDKKMITNQPKSYQSSKSYNFAYPITV